MIRIIIYIILDVESYFDLNDIVVSDDCNGKCDKSGAEDVSKSTKKAKSKRKKRHIPSASTALLIGAILGLVQAILLIFGAEILLHIMGVKSVSAICK